MLLTVIMQNIVKIIDVAVEIFLIFLYFSLLSQGKRSDILTILLYVLMVTALSATVLIFDNTMVCFLVTVGILSYIVFIVYNDSLKHRLFWILIYLLIIFIKDGVFKLSLIINNCKQI